MMKKNILLLLALVFAMASYADKVTEQQALQKAQCFFKDKQIVSRALSRSMTRSDQSSILKDFYVFNAENNGGFVIISGDDRTPEVLGYADSGYLDLDTLPANIKWWLAGYSKQISSLGSSNNETKRAFTRTTRSPIAILMTTKWGQDNPYNIKCPDFFGQGNCVTGCVATAMAQVLYYHRAKSTNRTTATIPGYNCATYWEQLGQLTIDEIPQGTIIDWANMLDKYNGSETIAQKEAVANLMLYCGASVKVDYGTNGVTIGRPAGSSSYTFDVPVALKFYFDYSENTTLVYRQDYTEEGWDELIYSELSKGNPIYYSGSNSSEGHAFVCDGYDGNGYYHINWGWDGLSDGFFLLSALNPAQQGTGGSSAGYNDGQCALIGAVPNGDIMRLSSQSVSLTGNTSFTLNEIGDNITVPVRWNIKNQTGTSYSFDHAIGLYHNGEFVKVLEETGTSELFTADQEKSVDASLVIETNLSSGIYQLYALSKSQGEEKWFRNENSSDNFITLVVKEGSMSFYVGKPTATENVIIFADDEVKRICVENWDTDGDGEISYDEAAAVSDFGYVFDRSIIKTFDEAQYFTGIISFGLTSEGAYGCTSLVSIKIPSSATSIRDGAFYACKALTSIEIPSSVKEIGKNAFQTCFSLQEVIIHEGLEKINDDAFSRCIALGAIKIPASFITLGENVWYGCSNLNDIIVDSNNPIYCDIDGVLFSKDRKTLIKFPSKREGIYNIPSGTEYINSYAFYGSNLESMVFPPSVTSLGDFALREMINLKDFTIPSTITTIGRGVFSVCLNLKNVILSEGISVIPEELFVDCFSLKNVQLPESLSSIGSNAFLNCGYLTEITIPSQVTSIGDYAFANASALRKVKSLMQSPCTITSTVFENINSNTILYVPEESLNAYKEADNWNSFTRILAIGEMAIEPYAELYNSTLSFYYDKKRDERSGITYEIPSGSIPFVEWYDNWGNITAVIFDASFANVRPNTTLEWFHNCDKLTEIQGIENLNTSEVTDMRSMFSGCRSLTSIDLSNFKTNKVTSMSTMFWECNNLKTVILPNDLTFIDSYQFVYCSSLTDVSIPASVTTIGERAFHYCTSLKEITIPAQVTSIGDNAFSYSGLTKVTSLMQTPCGISSTVFENISNNATLYVPAGCVDTYKAADGWKDFGTIEEIAQPSAIIVTAKSYSRTYGEANPTFDSDITGGTVKGTPSITCAATATSDVGTYDIVITAGTITDPNVQYVNGTLTINKAPLKITAKSYTRKEGEANPEFEVTYDGFKNNETATVFTTQPTITCAATKDSPAGTYDITVSGAVAGNYEISYVAGTLTIEAVTPPTPMPEPKGTVFDLDTDDSSSKEVKITFIVKDSDSSGTPTVAISDDKDASGSVSIPETVTHNGVEYKVTEIGEGAFQNNTGLTEVKIPASITSIGANAFAGCKNLQSITINIIVPINLSVVSARGLTRTEGCSVFDGVNKETCILYVPEGSVDAYKAAPVWKEFKNILPIKTSTRIYGIESDGDVFDVYSLSGQKVKSKATSLDGLPNGIYIVNGKKVMKK